MFLNIYIKGNCKSSQNSGVGRQRLTAVSAVLSNMKRKIKDKSKKIKVKVFFVSL